MTPLVPLTLYGWAPAVVILFMVLPPRRAAIVAFVVSWLFLPIYGYTIQGWLPNYDKVFVSCAGVFIAAMIFDARRLMEFRLHWYDLPMLAWCLMPFVSAHSGGFGSYEGFSGVMNQVVAWGLPYMVGRLYLKDLNALRDLAVAVVIGGLLYVPLCLFEIRMSPMLHVYVYGFHQHDFLQSRRGGGWRPTVFMQHGLAVGMYMCTAALMATWLWRTRAVKSIMGIPMFVVVPVLLVTAVLVKSTGALVLMGVGLIVLFGSGLLRVPLLLFALAFIPPAYMVLRTIGGWDGAILVDLARLISGRAADSLRTRLLSEDQLWHVVQDVLAFGAGRFQWAGFRVDESAPMLIPDGLWIVALGRNGLAGLTALTIAILLPAWVFMRRFNARLWSHPLCSPGAAWGVVAALYMIDSLANAMVNPIYLLAVGGLTATMNPWKGYRVQRAPEPAFSYADQTLLVRRPPLGQIVCAWCAQAWEVCRCARKKVVERLVGAKVARRPVDDADFGRPPS